MSREPRDAPQFYLTAPCPCPYLPHRQERKVFTHLIGKRAVALNDTLTQSGIPSLPDDRLSTRLRGVPRLRLHPRQGRRVRAVAELPPRSRPQRRRRRAWSPARNRRPEQYSLFRGYLDARHGDGGMADMSVLDYSMMIEDSHVESRLVEYRVGGTIPNVRRRLMAVCLTDMLADGLSMVYSFYEPDERSRSLGTYHDPRPYRARAAPRPAASSTSATGSKGSKKMAYKARFLPAGAPWPAGVGAHRALT